MTWLLEFAIINYVRKLVTRYPTVASKKGNISDNAVFDRTTQNVRLIMLSVLGEAADSTYIYFKFTENSI